MEKEIIKSCSLKFKWIIIVFTIIAVISLLIFTVPTIPSLLEALDFYDENVDFAELAYKSDKYEDEYSGTVYDNDGKASRITLSRYEVVGLAEAENGLSYAFDETNFGELLGGGLLISLLSLLCGVLAWLLFRFTTITVTNKRIYYRFIFLQYDVLPIDAVTSASTFFIMGVSVGTSSKKVRICLITNYKQVHEAIVNLMIERQGKIKNNSETISETI